MRTRKQKVTKRALFSIQPTVWSSGWHRTAGAINADLVEQGFGKFRGPGWYITAISVALVVPCRYKPGKLAEVWSQVQGSRTQYDAYIFERDPAGVFDAFNAIVNAPVRLDTRSASTEEDEEEECGTPPRRRKGRRAAIRSVAKRRS